MTRAALLRVLLCGLLLALGVAGGRWWSQWELAARSNQPVPPGLRLRLESLEAELEIAHTRNAVDQASLEMVRSELSAFREQIAVLEEELRFYRSLMNPGDIAQGLSLRDLELVKREAPGQFAFRIVVQQGARKHTTLKGDLRAEVYGREGEEQVSYPLSALSSDVEGESIGLRFLYFQSIEGVLALPEGFEPEGVRISARATAPRSMEANGDYPWQVKERFTHVGK